MVTKARFRERIASRIGRLCILLAILAVCIETAIGQSLLAVPAAFTVENDDRVATVWFNDFLSDDYRDPTTPGAGAHGYQCQWGPTSNRTSFTRFVREPVVQLQPLTNGLAYVLRVRAIDPFGRVSEWSAPVAFTGSPRRVNRLRKEMTGFFDDFNKPAGPLSEKTWNAGYSRLNEPSLSSLFINNQFHAHNRMGLWDPAGRGIATARPRRVFDFTGRTGNIVFDLDGAWNEDFWYLDLVPASSRTDVPCRVERESEQTNMGPTGIPSFPFNSLRFAINAWETMIIWIDDKGNNRLLAHARLGRGSTRIVPNVQRHFSVRVSRRSDELIMDGKRLVFTDALQIPYGKASVLFTQFQYESPEKWNQESALVHWDNFGFDGPASKRSPVTLNYKPPKPDGFDAMNLWWEIHSETRTVRIPDSLRGSIGARLHFLAQPRPGSAHRWTASDSVVINGRSFAIPQPPLEPQFLRMISQFIPLPANAIRTGWNNITFRADYGGFHGIHIEVDFPASMRNRRYTPPAPGAAAPPTLPKLGPSVITVRVGGHYLGDHYNFRDSVFDVSGTINLEVWADGHNARIADGSEPQLSRLEVLGDSVVVNTIRTDAVVPAVAGRYLIPLDTQTLTNGVHEVFVRGWSTAGIASIPNYVHAAGKSGSYLPFRIRVAN